MSVPWTMRLQALGAAARLCDDCVDVWSVRPETWANNIRKYKAYAEILRQMAREINLESLRETCS